MPAALSAPAVVARPSLADTRPATQAGSWVGALLGPLVVACAGTILAARAYARFLEVAPHLWTSGIHDRNAHYWLGLNFALDFRQGDVLSFLHDLHTARVWTPLHGLLVGIVLAVGGLDYRLAVLPSLAAWVGTAMFAFLVARRAVPRGGNLAGFTAALLVLASPAHQAFGTDIMLESLGACLSLAVIYACLVAVQEPSVWGGRMLGLTLTALFFHKYNYWLLVVIGLVAAAVMANPRRCLQTLLGWFRGPPARRASEECHGQLAARATSGCEECHGQLAARATSGCEECHGQLAARATSGCEECHGQLAARATPRQLVARDTPRWPIALGSWLKAQLRQPLTYLLVPIVGFLAVALFCGGDTLSIAGQRISMNPPHNIVHVAFCLLVLRVLPWWWRTGRVLVRQLDAPERQLVSWHLWPVILWFLWPQRLGNFLWYLTRDHGQEATANGLSGGLAYYWHSLRVDYHQGSWTLPLAVALVGAAGLSWRRLRPGGAVVLWFVLVAAALTFLQPSHRSRFLHSWVAAGWVAAGIGLAQLVYGRWTGRWPGLRPWLSSAALAGLGLLQLPGMIEAGHAPEGGPQANQPSVLELTDSYLPALDDARRPAIFSNMPIKFLTGWTLRERRWQYLEVETELKGFGASPAEDRLCFENWLATTTCDAMVLIDFSPGSVFHAPLAFPDYRPIKDWLAADARFTPAGHMELPHYGCAATIWRRASATPLPTGRVGN